MVKTGYISFITETPGGQDADGNPVAATKVNSLYLPCNLATNAKEYKVLVDQQWKYAKYSVYLDQDKFNTLDPAVDLTAVTEVQLQDNNGNDLETHQVHNVEYLNLTKRVKIIV